MQQKVEKKRGLALSRVVEKTEKPKKRSEGQRLVPVPMSHQFVAAIQQTMKLVDESNMSQFIRTAVYEKMAREGVEIERALTQPPGRAKINYLQSNPAMAPAPISDASMTANATKVSNAGLTLGNSDALKGKHKAASPGGTASAPTPRSAPKKAP